MRKGPPAGERIGIGRGEVGDRHGEAVVLQQVFDAAGVIDHALSLPLVEVERRRFHAQPEPMRRWPPSFAMSRGGFLSFEGMGRVSLGSVTVRVLWVLVCLVLFLCWLVSLCCF